MNLGIWTDFRADLSPATAQRRFDHFSALRVHLDMARTVADVNGTVSPALDTSRDTGSALRDLANAHVRLAEVQLGAIGEKVGANPPCSGHPAAGMPQHD